MTTFSARLAAANLLFVVLAVAAILAWRRGRLFGRPSARALAPPVIAFVLASLASAAFSLDPLASVAQLPRLAYLALVPLAAALLDERWWQRALVGLGGMTAVLSVWGIVQYLQGSNSLDDRIRGPLSHYMTYSGWLLLAVLVLAAEVLLRPSRRTAWLALPAATGTAAILLSLTRNAWIGLAVGALLLAAVWRRRLLLAYPVLAVAVWFVAPAAVVERMVSTFDLRYHANYDRLCMVISGVQMTADRPWTGVGLEMVGRLYPLYRRDDAPRWRVPHLHNNPVQIAAERGLPGLAAYLWLIGAFFTVTWRGLRRLKAADRAAVAAPLVAVAGITVAGVFEYNFWDAEVQLLTLVLLGCGVGRVERAASSASGDLEKAA